MICWSLLNNKAGSRDPVTLWRAQSEVRTGYLVSSASRIHGVHALSWAPQCPYIRPNFRSVQLQSGRLQSYRLRVPSYDGEGSLLGHVTDSGLISQWLAMEMTSAVLEDYREHCLSVMDNLADVFEEDPLAELDDPRIQDVYTHPDEANLFIAIDLLIQSGARVRLIRPLSEDGRSAYGGNAQRGEDFGLVAVLCASYDNGATWTWKDVYQWQEPDNHDEWDTQDMIIV